MTAPPTVPESMAVFVEAIGSSATMSVIRTFGGVRIYVPRQKALHDEHPLVRLLGWPLAMRLAHDAGGERHDIPRCASAEVLIRNEEILRRFREGAPLRRLSLQFGLSTRTIWRVVNQLTSVPTDTTAV